MRAEDVGNVPAARPDVARFAALIVLAGIAGLAVAATLTLVERSPGQPAAAASAGEPGPALVLDTAGRRWLRMADVPIFGGVTAGRRWTQPMRGQPLVGPETAGRRWNLAVQGKSVVALETAGRRWRAAPAGPRGEPRSGAV